MKHSHYIFIAIAALFLVSITLKTQRYIISHMDENLRIASIVTSVLQKQGWTEIPTFSAEKPQALSIFKYQKKVCEKPLLLTFLNFGEATSNVLQSAIGSDILFIYDGKTSLSFPAKKQFYRVILKSLQNIFHFKANHEMPIIAVSNNATEPQCENKLVAYWAEIETEFNK